MSAISTYRLITRLAAPLVARHLKLRRRRGKEDAGRLGERLGRPGLPRPAGPLVWIHAASVGESISALPLVDALCSHPAHPRVLVTTGTVTSADLMADRLPPGALHQYSPVDLPHVVAAFLDHWRPDLALMVESELWPNLLGAIDERGIPRILINGRLSDRSFRRWRRWPRAARSLIGGFKLCLAQDEDTVTRLEALGAETALTVGNLKFAAPPLPANDDELAHLKAVFGDRPRWLAASTHGGEDAPVIEAHRRLASTHPGLITILAPRHPRRGGDIAALAREAGLSVARRGLGEAIDADTNIYIADTLGEMGLWFRLCDIVFMGGTLAAIGGHNLLEPARLDSALVAGPHLENFRQLDRRLTDADALVRVEANSVTNSVTGAATGPGADLADAVSRLLTDRVERQRLIAAAAVVAADEDDVLERVIDRLAPHLDALCPPAEAAQ